METSLVFLFIFVCVFGFATLLYGMFRTPIFFVIVPIYVIGFIYIILNPYPNDINKAIKINSQVVKVEQVNKDKYLYTLQSNYGRFTYYQSNNKIKNHQNYQFEIKASQKYSWSDRNYKIKSIKKITSFNYQNDVNTNIYGISKIYDNAKETN